MLSPLPRRSGWAYSSLCFTPPVAQQDQRMKLIGVFPSAGLDQSRVEVFLQAMQQLGWSDSRNVRLDIRWGAGNPETNRKRAEEMVALAPAIIVAFGSSAVAALLQATRWCSRGSLTRLAPAMRKCSRIVRGGDFSG